MEAKEGIVLDRDGHPIHDPQGPLSGANAGFAQVRVWRGGWGLALALGVGIPLLLVAGFLIFAVFVALVAILGVFRFAFGRR